MKIRPLDNGSWRVHFGTGEYNILLESVPHQDARIAERLMAHSLRVKTTAELYLNQFSKRETPHGTIWTVHVEAKDTSDRDSALLPREPWICEPLIREIEDFAAVDDLDAYTEPTPLFQVSKRTIQNWVTKTAENAATATGDDNYQKVSSHDFRRYFASHLLYRHNVDPEVVRQLGGWQSPRAMMEYLLLPDDVLADELGAAGLLGAAADRRPADGKPYRKQNALETLTATIEAADQTDQKRIAEEVLALFDDVQGVDVALASSSGAAERAAESMSDSFQSSFLQQDEFGTDESGSAYPMAAAKAAYLAGLVLFSWTLTFGTLA